MADNFDKLRNDLQRELNDLKKEQLEIEERLTKQSRINGPTQQRYAELTERISNIEKTRLETEKKLKAERDKNFDRLKEEGKFTFNQVNFSKELTKLAKKSNALAKSKKGIILENFGLEAKNTKFIDAAKKATNAKEKTAYKELEKLRLDSLEELGEGTFDLDIFKSKIADIDLPDKLKDSLTDKFSTAADDAEAIQKAMDMDLPFLNALDSLQGGIEAFTSVLTNTKLLAVAIAGFLVKAIIDFGKAVLEVRNDLGLSAKNALELSANMKQASIGAKLVGGDTAKAEEAIKAFAEQTGRVNQLSANVSTQFGIIASRIGASSESMGTLFNLTMMANNGSQEKALADIQSLEAIAKSENLLGSQVFDDVADAAKTQALFFGKSVKEIVKATKEMRKLGIETSALNDVAESLLDLETSISNQFTLQLLTNKNINFNELRRLAFLRDGEGLATELTRQFGNQFDLSKMNAAEAKALQQSIGLSNEAMTKLVNGMDPFNNKAKEGNKIFDFLRNNAVSLGAVLGGLVGLLISAGAAIRSAFTAGFSLLKEIPLMAKNFSLVIGGVGTGAAIGAKIGDEARKALGGKMEDAQVVSGVVDRKPVGSQSVGASFSLGDNSINVTKDTQTAINLEMDKLVSVIREELVTEVKRGLKDVAMKVTEVKGSTDRNTSAVKGLAI